MCDRILRRLIRRGWLIAVAFWLVTGALIVSDVRADSVTVLFTFEGTDSESMIGVYLNAIGDINADGFDDISVSSQSPRGTYVFFGGDPADNTPDYFLRGSGRLGARVDMTGDGIPDLVIGAPEENKIFLYHGFADSIASQPSDSIAPSSGVYSFGALAETGIVSGDAIGDLVCVDRQHPDGRRFYYFENPFTTNDEPAWEYTTEGFSHGIGGIGFIDYDGDLVLDLYVGLPGDLDSSGYVHIYFGPALPTDPDVVIVPPDGFDSLGSVRGKKEFASQVSNIGDYTGDGYDELSVFYSVQPFLYTGGPNGDTLFDYYLESHARFRCARSAGDVNGDGFNDVVIGDTRSYWGAVDVYLGGPKADTVYDFTITDSDLPVLSETYLDIGFKVGGAGDFNGDGYDDIIIACKNLAGGGGNPYSVYVVAGSPDMVTDVTDAEQMTVPSDFTLRQNYPNPFNPSTTIEFQLPERSSVTLTVSNILGQEVVVLVNRTLSAGTHKIIWDGMDDDGRPMPSGVYLYDLKTNDYRMTRKMLLLK